MRLSVRWREELFNGIANMGIRPTVDGSKPVLEIHIFNFSGVYIWSKIDCRIQK